MFVLSISIMLNVELCANCILISVALYLYCAWNWILLYWFRCT